MQSQKIVKLLAVDDNPENLEFLSTALKQEGLEISTANDPEQGFQDFLRIRPRIVLLDLVMPGTTGMELLQRMVTADPGAEVILMTAHYSTDSAVEAIQKGASDYLTKPLSIEKLKARIQDFLQEAKEREKTLQLDHELMESYQYEHMVGRSPAMLEIFAKIRRIARHFRTVLVTGPTGTGKELVARALHNSSPVSKGNFAVCNCSALMETLVESELFGYVRGAFTGATQDRAGLFEYANGGTVFLDEIGELPLSSQSKLLRVLQTHQVQRVGSPKTHDLDIRVVAATNRNLRDMVKEGKFREDLFYRLSMVELSLPRLSDRREDLPLLQRHFLEKFSGEYGKTVSGIARRAQTRMAAYPWPGNVRELENVIGRACMMTEKDLIDVDDLDERFHLATNGAEANGDSVLLSLEEVQNQHILRVLDAVGGNKVKAAEVLGISRASIYDLLGRIKSASPRAQAAQQK